MPGTIRRPLPEPGTADPFADSTPPPPAYSSTVTAGQFQQQQQRPHSYAHPVGPPPGRSASTSSHASSTARPVSAMPAVQSVQGLQRSNTGEDRMAVLRRYDTCILIDDSASMGMLWHEAEAALAGIVERVIHYDADGLDVYFLNSQQSLRGVKDPAAIRELFQYVGPVGESTPTEVRVEELLSPYIEACERAKRQSGPGQMPKPLNCLILTDGAADDPDTLAYTLTGFAKRLDAIHAPLTQLGVQFVQIGNDSEATEALKELDDELEKEGCRDMVDTTPYQGQVTPEFLMKTVLGSINRRIDRSG